MSANDMQKCCNYLVSREMKMKYRMREAKKTWNEMPANKAFKFFSYDTSIPKQ